MKQKKYTLVELNSLRLEANELFTKFKGVVGVGYGLKEKNGKTINIKALRVYTQKKKPLEMLSKDEIIPKFFKGLRTDVCHLLKPVNTSCFDSGGHNQAIGGINITPLSNIKTNEWNVKIHNGVNPPSPITEVLEKPISDFITDYNQLTIDGNISFGTGGGVFKIRNTEHDNYVLLTNQHVLHPSINGDKVYHSKRNGVNGSIETNSKKIEEYANYRKELFELPVNADVLKRKIEGYDFSEFLDFKFLGKVFLKSNVTESYAMTLSEHGNTPLRYYVDCAYVHLDTQYSKTCRRYKGIKFNTQNELIRKESDNIVLEKFVKVRTLNCADIGKKVFKVGARSGKTEGIITDVFGFTLMTNTNGSFMENLENQGNLNEKIASIIFPADILNKPDALQLVVTILPIFKLQDAFAGIDLNDQLKVRLICEFEKFFEGNTVINKDAFKDLIKVFFEEQEVYLDSGNIIIIKSDQDNCEGKKNFADHGDSGSLLITENNELVGLIYGKSNNGDGAVAYACHISPVLEYLNINPVFDQNRRSKKKRNLENENQIIGENIEFDNLRSLLLESTNGVFAKEVLESHYTEIADLIHHHRAVKVAWHRNNGPAYLAHFEKSYKEELYKIPFEVKGINLIHSLQKVREALYTYGSKPLKKALDDYADKIIETSMSLKEQSVKSFLDNLNSQIK